MLLKISENTYIPISTIIKISIDYDETNKQHINVETNEDVYIVLETSKEYTFIMKFVEQSTFTGTVPYPSVYTNQPERQLQTEAMVLYKDKDNNVR